VIVSIREVEIEPDEGIGAGAVLGGVGGGLVGSMFGKGGGKIAAAAAGAAVGGIAGHKLQNRTKKGREYTVKLESGAIISLTQGVTPSLGVGERVLLIHGGRDRSRLVPE
jgi:outer membrane lipoprotein SlyB